MTGLTLDEVEDLYARYGETVLTRCRQLLQAEDRAWDAMHSTFVTAIRKRHTFRGDGAPLGWLYTIATRICLDELRSRGRVSAEPAADRDDQGQQAGTLLNQQTVARLLVQFPRRVQEIVILRYFDELEVQEIAHRTGTSERTIARRLQRFLTKARTMLAAESTR
jgi:RNA polymerase sigma-70 factor (ECF subfamily)